MELHEHLFPDLIEYNAYADALSKENVIIKPVTVIPQFNYGGDRIGLFIFYTKEIITPFKSKDPHMKKSLRNRAGERFA